MLLQTDSLHNDYSFLTMGKNFFTGTFVVPIETFVVNSLTKIAVLPLFDLNYLLIFVNIVHKIF